MNIGIHCELKELSVHRKQICPRQQWTRVLPRSYGRRVWLL